MFDLFRRKKKSPQQLEAEVQQALRRRAEIERDTARRSEEADAEQAARIHEEAGRMSPGERRRRILDRAKDVGIDFVFYDRKDDEELPRGHIEDAIASGEIAVDDITRTIANSIRRQLGESRRGQRRVQRRPKQRR